MPRAGEYRCRVEIQRQAVSREASGAESPGGYRTIANRWAAIRPAGGREANTSQQVQAIGTHEVRLRYWDGLNVEHRIKYGVRTFDINSIEDVNMRHIELLVLCTEVPAEMA